MDAATRRGWRWWVGHAGRVLIAAGILVLLFAAYQLWGTGIQTARSQDRLSSQFDEALAAASSTTASPTTTVEPVSSSPATTGPATTTQAPPATAPPPPAQGEAVARIEAPSIGLDWIVVEGVDVADLRMGPGRYPGTAMPGERGNVAIAGHRTTWGAPFEDVGELEPGDEIVLTSVTGRYVYRVTGTRIVGASETSVLDPSEEPILTLTSCHPKYSASQRIIITAAFDQGASSPLLEPASAVTTVPVTRAPPATLPGEVTSAPPATTAVDDPVVVTTAAEPTPDTFGRGWVSDSKAWSQLAVWGAVLVLISVGAWWLGKRIPRWAAYLAAVVPFTFALYFFFDNVNRLLPPNL